MKNRFNLMLGSALGVLLVAGARSAVAESDGGIWVGPANLSPTLSVGVFYDDNPDEVNESRRRIMRERFMEEYGKEREKSAKGFNITPGLLLSVPGNDWRLDGGIHYTYEKDDSDFSRDPKDWKQSLALRGSTDGGTRWGLSESWQRLYYSQFDDFSQDDREAFALGATLDRDFTDKSGGSLSASYRTVDYKDRELYDRDSYGVRAGARHKLTDKSNLMFSLGFTENQGDYRRRMDREGNILRGKRSKDRSYSAQAGLGSRASEKISYHALLGLAYVKSEYGDDPLTGERIASKDKYRLSYNLSGNWRASERLTLAVSGNSAYESSEDVLDNSLMAYTLSGRANYRLMTRFRVSGGLSYRREEYVRKVALSDQANGNPYVGTDAGGRGRSRDDDQISLFGDVTCGINRYASTFVNVIYSKTSSSIDDFDYDRYRISAGVALQY